MEVVRSALPEFPGRLSLVQYSRNSRRLHAITVSGLTITQASRPPGQARDQHGETGPDEAVDEHGCRA